MKHVFFETLQSWPGNPRRKGKTSDPVVVGRAGSVSGPVATTAPMMWPLGELQLSRGSLDILGNLNHNEV